jgi:uncharacterized BrkB/YihY/UPF0761 family membrane protein
MRHSLWRKFLRDWGWNLARLLAYTLLQGLFAIAALDLVLLALILRTFKPEDEQDFASQILRLLPDRVTYASVSAFEHSLRHTSIFLLIAALPIALWYGSRFFVVMETCLSVIFRRRQRSFLRQNLVALGMLVITAVLLPVIVFSATLVPSLAISHTAAHTMMPRLTDISSMWIVGVLASLCANFTLMFIAYTWVTPRGVSWKAALPGALLAACLAQLYLLIFPLYVHLILHPDHFGTVAGFLLVVLVFFFAFSLFIVIGAEVSAWLVGVRTVSADITAILAEQPEAADLAYVDPSGLFARRGRRRSLLAGILTAIIGGATRTPTP